MDHKSPPNSDQVPRDLALTRIINNPAKPSGYTEPPEENRFEVQQSGSLKDDYLKRLKQAESNASGAPAAKTNSGDHAVSGDNYLKAYLDERAKQDDARAAAQKQAADKARTESEQQMKDAMAKRQIDDYRMRARELQNQIQWWRQQEGMGTHDAATIQGQISNLEWQLNAIPREYWF